jgi:hypothetical protein
MPDRTFGEPGDDDEWINRRDDLVAELRRPPYESQELRRFTTLWRASWFRGSCGWCSPGSSNRAGPAAPERTDSTAGPALWPVRGTSRVSQNRPSGKVAVDDDAV